MIEIKIKKDFAGMREGTHVFISNETCRTWKKKFPGLFTEVKAINESPANKMVQRESVK